MEKTEIKKVPILVEKKLMQEYQKENYQNQNLFLCDEINQKKKLKKEEENHYNLNIAMQRSKQKLYNKSSLSKAEQKRSFEYFICDRLLLIHHQKYKSIFVGKKIYFLRRSTIHLQVVGKMHSY